MDEVTSPGRIFRLDHKLARQLQSFTAQLIELQAATKAPLKQKAQLVGLEAATVGLHTTLKAHHHTAAAAAMPVKVQQPRAQITSTAAPLAVLFHQRQLIGPQQLTEGFLPMALSNGLLALGHLQAQPPVGSLQILSQGRTMHLNGVGLMQQQTRRQLWLQTLQSGDRFSILAFSRHHTAITILFAD